MSNADVLDALSPDLVEQIKQQAGQATEFPSLNQHLCTEDDQVACAIKYGPHAVHNKILISISDNINIMAQAISQSEDQKSAARDRYIKFFQGLLIFLVFLITVLITAGTFFDVPVRLEFLISIVAAIIADVFAIVRTLVKYMTSLEHYNAYNKLINSLLQSINRQSLNSSRSPLDSQ